MIFFGQVRFVTLFGNIRLIIIKSAIIKSFTIVYHNHHPPIYHLMLPFNSVTASVKCSISTTATPLENSPSLFWTGRVAYFQSYHWHSDLRR
jgi:hypothetical protein